MFCIPKDNLATVAKASHTQAFNWMLQEVFDDVTLVPVESL